LNSGLARQKFYHLNYTLAITVNLKVQFPHAAKSNLMNLLTTTYTESQYTESTLASRLCIFHLMDAAEFLFNISMWTKIFSKKDVAGHGGNQEDRSYRHGDMCQLFQLRTELK
jgi:hypothetical protein